MNRTWIMGRINCIYILIQWKKVLNQKGHIGCVSNSSEPPSWTACVGISVLSNDRKLSALLRSIGCLILGSPGLWCIKCSNLLPRLSCYGSIIRLKLARDASFLLKLRTRPYSFECSHWIFELAYDSFYVQFFFKQFILWINIKLNLQKMDQTHPYYF